LFSQLLPNPRPSWKLALFLQGFLFSNRVPLKHPLGSMSASLLVFPVLPAPATGIFSFQRLDITYPSILVHLNVVQDGFLWKSRPEVSLFNCFPRPSPHRLGPVRLQHFFSPRLFDTLFPFANTTFFPPSRQGSALQCFIHVRGRRFFFFPPPMLFFFFFFLLLGHTPPKLSLRPFCHGPFLCSLGPSFFFQPCFLIGRLSESLFLTLPFFYEAPRDQRLTPPWCATFDLYLFLPLCLRPFVFRRLLRAIRSVFI